MIRLGSDHELLEMESIERHAPDRASPSIRVRVGLTLPGFHGQSSDVWLFGQDLDEFVRDVRALEAKRSGSASLDSGDEFRLELRPVDRVGHYEACVSLGAYQHSGATCWLTVLSGGFEIDPSQLPDILRAFEALRGFCNGEG